MVQPKLVDFQGKHVHLIGIGGSSMSGLALMLHQQGYIVSGSDRTDGYLLGALREKQIPVAIGHAAEQVHGADLVVYTAAIPKTNPEYAEAVRLGLPMMERAELLGQLANGYAESVAISGAHGKTSTTSMLAQMLLDAGLNPTVHIGGQLDAIGGSTRLGSRDCFVAEACEFNRSFLHMHPTVAVVLNIDADHLDCYQDIDEIEATFGLFLQLLPENGLAIGNGDDPRVLRQLKRLHCRICSFGLQADNDLHPDQLMYDEQGRASFDAVLNGKTIGHVDLAVAGAFNVMNALAAIGAAVALGAEPTKVCASLSGFHGAHRRFELTDTINGTEVYTDYGHNPTEMRNALSIAKLRAKALGGRLIAVMQPHTFSRVRTLFDSYLTCTEEADLTIVTDIMAAREPDPGDLNSGMLVDGMRQHGIVAEWTPSFDDAEAWLRRHWQPGDVVLTMGCGDIHLLNAQIHRHEQEKA